jgi:hypothetical protein
MTDSRLMPSAMDDRGHSAVLHVASYDVTLDLTWRTRAFWTRAEVGSIVGEQTLPLSRPYTR